MAMFETLARVMTSPHYILKTRRQGQNSV
jgi:hypothetical protein